ncbi:PQQ-like beta-propeller repeat protein [Streptomyces pseudovenezuelae]|uniref:outer membrane protein assembly factor BamB family protein n=1 Tax=Streptomyces pseudovenezuelae TaxID=67350 RepID=UPI002E2EBAA4|nr:PQQ-binding-like beta-propeller repeat protein [Streptomyces pseudovenezuelae]
MYEDRAPESVWLPRRRWRKLKPVWEARHTGRADTEALGSLLHEGLVVRAAFDRLRAFEAGTGRERWAWEVPGRDVLAAMTDEVVDGVGLLAHWPDVHGGQRQAHVTALDMTSGETRWSVPRSLDELWHPGSGLRPGTIALSGGLAMVATGTAVVALDLRTGRQVWVTQHSRDHDVWIGAAGERLVVVTRHEGTATVRAVSVADGRVLWKKSPAVDGPVAAVRLVCADPLLVAVEGEGRRGADCLLRLDAEGNTVTEFASADDGARFVPHAPWRLDHGQPWTIRAGDTLVAFVDSPTYQHLSRLAGFSLSTGRHLWTRENTWDIDALASHRGHVVTLRHHKDETEDRVEWGCEVRVLDPVDGREVARRRLRVTQDEPYAMHLHGDRLLWVSRRSAPFAPPVKAYDWR